MIKAEVKTKRPVKCCIYSKYFPFAAFLIFALWPHWQAWMLFNRRVCLTKTFCVLFTDVDGRCLQCLKDGGLAWSVALNSGPFHSVEPLTFPSTLRLKNLDSIERNLLPPASTAIYMYFESWRHLRKALSFALNQNSTWRLILLNVSSYWVFVLLQEYSYTHLSAGDLLREERAREGSEYGHLIATHIKEGKIVPVQITIKLLQKVWHKYHFEIKHANKAECNLLSVCWEMFN